LSARARFVFAFAAGIPMAFLGLEGGLLVMGCMLFAAMLTLFNFGRLTFAGFTIALGGTWLIVFVLANQDCGQPSQPCGATPVDLTPHIVISAVLVALGAAAAIRSRRSSRGAVESR
jgi:hypothetical protein